VTKTQTQNKLIIKENKLLIVKIYDCHTASKQCYCFSGMLRWSAHFTCSYLNQQLAIFFGIVWQHFYQEAAIQWKPTK